MRPTREAVLMQTAQSFARRSTCGRRNVGAVIAMESRIISTGYNGAPSGMPHCNHMLNELPSAGCPVTVHAEANAIVWAARRGISTDDAEMFTTLSPCVDCAKLIVNAGISRLYYQHLYRDTSGLDLLRRAGLGVAQLGNS